MLNKKILAAAVAVALSQNAYAASDDDADDADFPDYDVATQSLTLTSGVFNVTNAVVTNDLGFSVGNGTSKYVLYRLSNDAVFDGTPTVADTGDAASTAAIAGTLSSGGDGESYALFEISATNADAAQTHDIILTSDYDAKAGKTTVTYNLYETGQQAIDVINEASTSSGLASASGNIAETGDALTGTFATAASLTALVANQFKAFTGPVFAGSLGATEVNDLVSGTWAQSDGTAFAAANLDDSAATVAFTGDFSFGEFEYNGAEWGYDEDGDLEIVTDAEDIALNEDGSVTVNYADGETLVVTTGADMTDAVIAQKGAYSAKLGGLSFDVGNADDFSKTEDLGSIAYDTTSIEIPYLSTFSGLKQKIFIVNKSQQAASYTTSFITEGDVTTEDSTKTTGEIPAGEMVTLKASELVTFIDGTRGSATIEIEAQNTKVLATSQTVNVSTGGTDTTVLYGELNTKD